MHQRHDIIAEIRRIAKDSGGAPPGRRTFLSLTGIKEADWLGRYWTKWSDALAEAGYPPNRLSTAFSEEFLLERLALLARELAHYPLRAELKMKRRADPTFPSHGTFERLGSKSTIAAALLQYSRKHGYDDVAAMCEPFAAIAGPRPKPGRPQPPKLGSVYLIRSGRLYKVGRTSAMGRREYELNIQLPQEPKLVHEIKTDDPVGIEHYWHERFKERRTRGEWFQLTPEDVAAFKARRFM